MNFILSILICGTKYVMYLLAKTVVMKRNEQYEQNKSAKVGEMIVCPICGKSFKKKQHAQAFCSAKHKNRFWNNKGDRHSNLNYHQVYNMRYPKDYIIDRLPEEPKRFYGKASEEWVEVFKDWDNNGKLTSKDYARMQDDDI